MKDFLKITMSILGLVLFAALQSGTAQQTRMIVFEGRVAAINPIPAIEISCGVAQPELLIQYAVEKIFVGAYEGQSIVVDHQACGASGVREMKVGDDVVVVAKLVHHVPEEIDPLRLRKKIPSRERYFVALSIGKRVFRAK